MENVKSDKTKPYVIPLMIFCILAIITSVWSIISMLIFPEISDSPNIFTMIEALVLPVGVAFLVSAFLKHRKNIQKALMGALLAYEFGSLLSYLSIYTSQNADEENPVLLLLGIVELILFAIVIINHIELTDSKINQDRLILINVIAFICVFVIVVANTFIRSKSTVMETINYAMPDFRDLILIGIIIYIEYIVNKYKTDRLEKSKKVAGN